MNTEIYLTAETELEKDNYEKVVAAIDFIEKAPTADWIRVMPDACPVQLGHLPVGGVARAVHAIHPIWHSADICCSLYMSDLGDVDMKKLMDVAFETTHFGVGGRQEFPCSESILEECRKNEYLASKEAIATADKHTGTQGDGNHFLFIGRSKETGTVRLITHHGSRGFGAYLYKQGVKVAENYRQRYFPNLPKELAWIPMEEIGSSASPTPNAYGVKYWEALQIVRKWTKANHAVIHSAVAEKLGVENTETIWNEHNFVFNDGPYYYHAKGATPMADRFVPDNKTGLRIIPLNMGAPILITKQKHKYHDFAPHGAGRNEGRKAYTRRVLENTTAKELIEKETAGLDVRFYTGKVDITELPSSYKDAGKSKEEISRFGLAEIVDEIEPYGSIMCGHQSFSKKKKAA